MSSSENSRHLSTEEPSTVLAEDSTSMPVVELEESNYIGHRSEELVEASEHPSDGSESLTHGDIYSDYCYYDWTTDEEMYDDYDIDGILHAEDLFPALNQGLVVDARRTIFYDSSLNLDDTNTTGPSVQPEFMAAAASVCDVTPLIIKYIEYSGEFIKSENCR